MLISEIKTPRLVLACLDIAHATEKYRAWMSDPEVTQFLETRFSAPTLDSLRDYIRQLRDSSDTYFFGIFARPDGRHIGNIKLGPVSNVHNRAAIGLVLGDKSAWGHGYATEAISALTDWAFDGLHLRKLSAGSYARNVGSIRAFERSGFEVEGRLRSHVRSVSGDTDDVVLLGRVNSTPVGASR
jgi:[ribosomal protein S5]-alanine N-acetyltransferase